MSKIAGKLNAEMMKKVIHDRRAKLFAEIVAKTGSKQSVIDRAMQEIESLRKQVEKLTKERDDLTKTLELMEHTRDTEQIRHREMMSEKREQLATLAEQNEKYRKVIPHCVVGASGYAVEQLFIECLSLPDLASPVLNRIRAEGVRKASTLVSLVRNDWASAGDNLSAQAAEYLISALDARATELEKTNG